MEDLIQAQNDGEARPPEQKGTMPPGIPSNKEVLQAIEVLYARMGKKVEAVVLGVSFEGEDDAHDASLKFIGNSRIICELGVELDQSLCNRFEMHYLARKFHRLFPE